MRKLNRFSLPLLLTGTLLAEGVPSASAKYAFFANNTDVIAVSGDTLLSNQCTIEAVFLLPSESQSGGSLFDDWVLGEEEKHVSISRVSIDAAAFPNNALDVSESRGLISLDTWHHIAFVCNGSEQRLYLDGIRIQAAPATAMITNSGGHTYIGYAPRNGSDIPSFVGYLDSIRVSNVARYAGLSFTPPMGDMTADADTILLYNFNEPAGSQTVADESPLGRTGTLGGYPNCTAPQLVDTIPVQNHYDLQIFPAVELQFSTPVGGQYQLQSSQDMAVWTTLPGILTGDGTITSKLISIRDTGRVFYRVVPVPASGP